MACKLWYNFVMPLSDPEMVLGHGCGGIICLRER